MHHKRGEPPEIQKTDSGQPTSALAIVSRSAQPSVSQLNPESHLRSEIGSYAIESRETEENRGAAAGKGEIAFPGTHGIGFTHLPLLQVRESPFGGEMVPNLPREDLLIGQIDPSRLISSTEVPENFSTVGLVLGEPTAQAGPTDSKDSRPRIGEAQPEPASSSTPMEFSIGEGSVAGSKRSWASSSCKLFGQVPRRLVHCWHIRMYPD